MASSMILKRVNYENSFKRTRLMHATVGNGNGLFDNRWANTVLLGYLQKEQMIKNNYDRGSHGHKL